jgi:hypothetical protein
MPSCNGPNTLIPRMRREELHAFLVPRRLQGVHRPGPLRVVLVNHCVTTFLGGTASLHGGTRKTKAENLNYHVW